MSSSSHFFNSIWIRKWIVNRVVNCFFYNAPIILLLFSFRLAFWWHELWKTIAAVKYWALLWLKNLWMLIRVESLISLADMWTMSFKWCNIKCNSTFLSSPPSLSQCRSVMQKQCRWESWRHYADNTSCQFKGRRLTYRRGWKTSAQIECSGQCMFPCSAYNW